MHMPGFPMRAHTCSQHVLRTHATIVCAHTPRLGTPCPQILLNLRRGNSGELSLLSCALSLAGNLARVFTTLVLVRDPIILASASTQVSRGSPAWRQHQGLASGWQRPPAARQLAIACVPALLPRRATCARAATCLWLPQATVTVRLQQAVAPGMCRPTIDAVLIDAVLLAAPPGAPPCLLPNACSHAGYPERHPHMADN